MFGINSFLVLLVLDNVTDLSNIPFNRASNVL